MKTSRSCPDEHHRSHQCYLQVLVRRSKLVGVDDVRPGRRIELLPVVVGGSTINANRDRNNPFDDGRNLLGRVGADFKMGLGPNLTLDATFNPDFGQVEADPAEVNLTAFATRFPERRPFFLEGARLMTPPNQSKFFLLAADRHAAGWTCER